ncbi:MAG: glycosyltransferase [Actinomycetes bacterium]
MSFRDLEGLKRTIDSVSSQSYKNVRHIVIDGGTPRIESIINKQALLKNHVFVSEPDRGIYDAMNKGLRVVESGLVCWLNSSDVFPDVDTLSRVSNSYLESNWLWAYGGMGFTSESSKPPKIRWQYPFRKILFKLGLRWIPHEGSYFTFDLLKKIGNYSLELGLVADQEFIMRAAKLATPNFLPFPCVIMEPGGSHSTLKGRERDKAWQNARKMNGLLLCNSKVTDDFYVLLSPLIIKFYYQFDKLFGKQIQI